MAQDLNNNISTYVRIRPLQPKEEPAVWTVAPEGCSVCLNNTGSPFSFSHIFGPENDNSEVYIKSVSPLLHHWLQGFNATIFAYGQTNSGKTHTIFGHPGTRGVAYQVLEEAFRYFESMQAQKSFLVSVSYYEVYNEQVFDLLQEGVVELQAAPIREYKGVFFADQVTQQVVHSVQEAIDVMQQGNARKRMGYSHLHDQSSRSHSIFTIMLASKYKKGNNKQGKQSLSEFNLVDLAGSECLTYNYGVDQQEETKNINLSLFSLKAVISALANKQMHVPYRNSALTKLLQNSLGGNSLTALICTISPAAVHVGFSKKTLAFGQIAKKVLTKPKLNVISSMFQNQRDEVKLRAQETVEVHTVKIQTESTLSGREQTRSTIAQSSSGAYSQKKDFWVKTPSGTVYCAFLAPEEINPKKPKRTCIILHGYPSDHKEWMYLFEPLLDSGMRVIAIDMPGFGSSSGKRQSSRTERHIDKDGTVDTLNLVLKHFEIKKCYMVGYDWGAGIALAYALQYPKKVSHIAALHPSWTDSLAKLNQCKAQVCFLWVPADQLHPFSLGKKMVRATPKGKLVKLDCGAFSADKAYDAWCCIGDQIASKILDFFPITIANQTTSYKKMDTKMNPKVQVKADAETLPSDDEGIASCDAYDDIEEDEEDEGDMESLEDMLLNRSARLEMNVRDDKKFKPTVKTELPVAPLPVPDEPSADAPVLDRQRWAVAEFRNLLFTGKIKEYYQAYMFSSGPIKSKAIKLFGSLPSLLPDTNPEYFKTLNIYPSLPAGWEHVAKNMPKYAKGRQVLLKTNVNAKVTAGDPPGKDYLTYCEHGDKFITYRAWIVDYDVGKDIFTVGVEMPENTQTTIKVPAAEILLLNEPTVFPGTQTLLTFEDGIKCNYENFLTKAKIMEAALSVYDLVPKLNFESLLEHSEQLDSTLELQHDCVYRIRQVFDLTHFHQTDFDKTKKRSAAPDVGKLAHYGQGNCHTLASVMAALLLPFRKLLGIEVKFRAGFYIKTGRDVDRSGAPIPGQWNGKPRSIDDHTWLELTFMPSMHSAVCDPSFHEITIPLACAYSCEGRRHPSANLQCNSSPPKRPDKVFDPHRKLVSVPLSVWEKSSATEQPPPLQWTKILCKARET